MSGGEELSSALQNAVDSLTRLSRAIARGQQQQAIPIAEEQLRALLEFHSPLARSSLSHLVPLEERSWIRV